MIIHDSGLIKGLEKGVFVSVSPKDGETVAQAKDAIENKYRPAVEQTIGMASMVEPESGKKTTKPAPETN
jgi:hypothetical protein